MDPLLQLLQDLQNGQPPTAAPGGAGSALIAEPPGTPSPVGPSTSPIAAPQMGQAVDPGLDFMTKFMMGRAMVGGRAAGDATGKWKDEGALEFLKTALPTIQKQQQEKMRQHAFATGVRGFQQMMASDDPEKLTKAEMLVAGITEMGGSDAMTKPLYGYINRERERIRSAGLGEVIGKAAAAAGMNPIIAQGFVELAKSDPTKSEAVLLRIHDYAKEREKEDRVAEATAIKEQLAAAKQALAEDKAENESVVVPPEGTLVNKRTGATIFKAEPRAGVEGKDDIKVTSQQAEEFGQAGVRLGDRRHTKDITDAEWKQKRDYEARVRSEQRASDRAATIAAVQAGEGSKRLKVHELGYFAKAGSLEPVAGMTVEESERLVAEGKVVRAVKPENINEARALRVLEPEIKEMERLLAKVLAVDPGANLAKGLSLAVRSKLSDTEVRQVEALTTKTVQWTTKAIQGARPSDYDVQQIQKIFPTKIDTVATAKALMGDFRRWAGNVERSKTGSSGETPWDKGQAPAGPPAAPSGRQYDLKGIR